MADRAEERALEAYPYEDGTKGMVCSASREIFIKGYHQAEKDLVNSLPEELETELKGWLVRDKDDYTAIYGVKPERGRTEWFDSIHPKNAEESSLLATINNAALIPDLEYEDEPIEVVIKLVFKNNEQASRTDKKRI